MDIRKNKKWLRKAAYAPLAVAVLAGAVCSGAGIGSATTDANAGTGDTKWRVHNNTDQVLTEGKFGKSDGGRPVGIIDVAGLKPGQSREGLYWSGDFMEKNFTMADGVCFNHQIWRLDEMWTAHERWRDVWVYTRPDGTPFVSPQGGGREDYDMSLLKPALRC
ncbi:hypothetical protein [Rhodococcus jostii]|uniref:hypothetical protein n=1 Tax=Rhodococcus jostii TaxID=132919 RepID=UPI003633731C